MTAEAKAPTAWKVYLKGLIVGRLGLRPQHCVEDVVVTGEGSCRWGGIS